MLKQSLVYLALSIIVVIFAHYFHLLIIYIDVIYTWINAQLAPIFSRGGIGKTVRQILVLATMPVIFASIPAFGYRLIKGSTMPHFYFITWLFWLVIVLSVLLIP